MNDAIQSFATFSAPQWIEWIRNEVEGKKNDVLYVNQDQPLDDKLANIYSRLQQAGYTTKDLTVAAISLIGEFSRDQQYRKPGFRNEKISEAIYCLLLFVGSAARESQVVELERLLKSGALTGLYFDLISLEHILLNEILNFSAISNYHDYFYEKANNYTDPHTCFIGLKYFYTKQSSTEYFRYLEKLIGSSSSFRVDTNDMAKAIVESLSDFAYHTKDYSVTWYWIAEYWQEIKYINAELFTCLNKAMLEWLKPGNHVITQQKNEFAISIMKFIQNIEERLSDAKAPVIPRRRFRTSSVLTEFDAAVNLFMTEQPKTREEAESVAQQVQVIAAQLQMKALQHPEEMQQILAEMNADLVNEL